MEYTELSLLLENGADANTKDQKGFTLLMSFASKCDVISIGELIKYGASVSLKDHLGYTALDYAIKVQCLKGIEYLVDHGAIVTEDSYMLAVRRNLKSVVNYFDSLDDDKQVFLKKKRK
jgi:ankyrin repeat protein